MKFLCYIATNLHSSYYKNVKIAIFVRMWIFACQWFNFYVGQFFRSDNFRTVKLGKISILEELSLKSTFQNWDAVRFLWKTIICIPDKNNQKATKSPIIARVLWKIARLQCRPTNYLDSLEYLLIGNLFCLHYISCNGFLIGFCNRFCR